jgi:hypothetical protein
MNYYEKYIKYKYKYNNLKNRINQHGGNYDSLWIRENFFSKKEFEDIVKYCHPLKLKNDPRSSNRNSLCLNPNKHKTIYDYIYQNKKFRKLIDSIKNDNLKPKYDPSYPIEYRKYFTGSDGMGWHIDTSLFDPDCFEIVLTLTNTSDSKFEWKDNGKTNSLEPNPNTLVVVRPQSVPHSVTPINVGERTILKFIIEFTYPGETDNIKKYNFSDEIEKCPF